MKGHLVSQFPVTNESSLRTLVENKTSFSFEKCELSIFETHCKAHNVSLTFDHFVLTSMLRGKKVMRLKDQEAFDYLPGESVVLSPGESMNIDFPEAANGNPTQCIALTISDEAIYSTIDVLNEYHPKASSWGDWTFDPSIFHVRNNQELADTISRILRITQNERGKAKDIMIDLTLKEMLVRLMQTQARHLFEASYHELSGNNALAATVKYIKENLSGRIDLDKLSNMACMSRASFYRKFKETMGLTPAQYIQKERLKLARALLRNRGKSVAEACYSSGFENISHFTRVFKSEFGQTPKACQLRV